LEVKTATGLQRGRASGDFSADTLNRIFDTKLGSYGTAGSSTPTERLVFQVAQVNVPPMGPADEAIAQQLSEQMENDLLQQYVDGLRKEFGVYVNERSFQIAVGGEQ
ncbi:MAG: hypothetical protein B7Y84_16230, partial [Azorhizobium sp. 32-67-21]